MAVITLTTDFGLTDAYVAAIKGVILGINPEATLVDICHNIKPQNIPQAAFVLSTAYQFFPQRTIHLVVVDPGVGTERKAIILRTAMADFVAPDNGVLSYVIQESSPRVMADSVKIQPRKLPSGLEAVAITEPRFWRTPVSPTFHGRDIFAPVAALLSLGFPPIEFGEAVTSLKVSPRPRPEQKPDGSLEGHILHIDNFGNLITSIKSDDLPPTKQPVTIEVANQFILGLSRTYAEGSGLFALIGSSGYLEIALKGGNAKAFLDAEVGDEVKLRQQPEGVGEEREDKKAWRQSQPAS
ncbi:MAG: S-adenosyl-l-methionine hydroxide adenosyltransferase [Dehalococcoidia bacterium]|nr:MAG: S-adenosyl-l-methionine hydroxide adenosyltransferase [Dehalococcoidia bacterium]